MATLAGVSSGIGCTRLEGPTGTASDRLVINRLPDSLYELDSVQLSVRLDGKLLSARAVQWSVSNSNFANISANAVLALIRATDFDQPYSHGTTISISAKAGGFSADRRVRIVGWLYPLPGFDEIKGAPYLESSSEEGVDEGGEFFYARGTLVLMCGEVTANAWSVDLVPFRAGDFSYPPDKIYHKPTLSSDTVSVAFDGESPRLERWERSGVRIRPPNGFNFLQRMLRARTLVLTVRSFDPTTPMTFKFRLGNVEQVTKANAYRACA